MGVLAANIFQHHSQASGSEKLPAVGRYHVLFRLKGASEIHHMISVPESKPIHFESITST